MNGAERAVRLTVTARSRSCAARVGVVETPSGAFDTPAFMPVGTQGTIKGLVMPLVGATGSQVILGNTYHLMLRPGAERVAALVRPAAIALLPAVLAAAAWPRRVAELSLICSLSVTCLTPAPQTVAETERRRPMSDRRWPAGPR